jgi:protein TonB
MSYAQIHDVADPRRELLRWVGCAAVVLAAHASLALALMSRPQDVDFEPGAPVITIELAPMAVAPPAPISELAPGPEQMQTESQERVAEEPKPELKEPEQKEIEVKREPETPPVPDPVVTLPLPEPPKEKPQEMTQEPKEEAPVPTAPPSIAAPAEHEAAPAIGREPRPTSAAIASWQRLLQAHLERHKRFPPQALGQRGIANLAFTIDRQGHVLSSRIAHSSGSPALDNETLAMIRRAEPLPVPPGGIADNQLSFTVPIRYGAGR